VGRLPSINDLGKIMNMQNYLDEIEHAANLLIEAVWMEYHEVEKLTQKTLKLTTEMEDGYRRAQAFQDSEDPDDIMLGVGIHWDTYFGADKERFHAEESLDDIQQKLQARVFSRESLSGNILQYAKQGISIVHGNLQLCPSGRSIGTQDLKTVIWQARNQSLHWEDGNFHQPVVTCFNLLGVDFDSKFAAYTNRNMAFDIIELLSWNNLSDFQNDMLLIA